MDSDINTGKIGEAVLAKVEELLELPSRLFLALVMPWSNPTLLCYF